MQEIQLRSIQHFLYCQHRWGLIEIDRAWAENYFVVKANLLHSRVHSGENYKSRDKNVYTDLYVWNDNLDIYGKLDCLERNNSALCIVEYKPQKPDGREFNEEDAMQVFAQKVCADYVFNTKCKAALYYADVKKRIYLPFEEKYDEYLTKLQKILAEMRDFLEKGVIPSISKRQKCGGCSMKDLCVPEVLKDGKTCGLHNRILDSIWGKNDEETSEHSLYYN